MNGNTNCIREYRRVAACIRMPDHVRQNLEQAFAPAAARSSRRAPALAAAAAAVVVTAVGVSRLLRLTGRL